MNLKILFIYHKFSLRKQAAFLLNHFDPTPTCLLNPNHHPTAMIGPASNLCGNGIHRFDPVGLLNENYTNRGIGARQSKSNRSSYNGITGGDAGGSSSLTFAVRTKGDGGDSDASSPKLWKMSPAGSPPPETCESQWPMSPNSRTQAIARGQRELMEMIKDLPESFYELSLRDIVDRNSSHISPPSADRDFADADDEKRPVLMADPRRKNVKKTMSKSRSFDNGGYLLKTSVFPIWFGLRRSKRKQKKKLFSSGSLKKVGPTPVTAEKEWWRRKSSEESSDSLSSSNSGSSSRSSSQSSSTSSSSCRQRQSNKFILGCCSFRKNKR